MTKCKRQMLCLSLVGILVLAMGVFLGCQEVTLPDPVERNAWVVYSPDGTIKTRVSLSGDGKLQYSVSKGGTTVVENSRLGFTIAEDDFRILTLQDAVSKKISGSYENKTGKHRNVSYDCNQTTLTFKAWDFYLDLIVRAYDDGYAFRYNIRAVDDSSGIMTVESEDTEFALPSNAALWAQPYQSNDPVRGNFFAYENPYVRVSVKDLGTKQLAMPMLYRIGSGDLYSLVTESDLVGSGYYGTFLTEQESNRGKGVLQTVMTPAGVQTDNEKVSYPFTSPWRVGMVGSMNTIVASELVEKVYDDVEYWRPDNYDELPQAEKEIYDYDWVDPGATAFSWLSYQRPVRQDELGFGGLQREYVDLASELGWKWTILDGGWDNNLTDEKLADFMDYANSKNVGVIVWCDAFSGTANANYDVFVQKLDYWASFGIGGIKIDFFSGETTTGNAHQGEDRDTVAWMETIYQECAKRKMLVNPHGCNKPTGERRKYPNVINREGIYGNEFLNGIDSGTTVNHLFTRNIMGVADFTPVVKPRSQNMTQGHVMALTVLFETGLPSLGDKAAEYLSTDVIDFYRNIPTLRDEIIFLAGAPDRFYAAAIKVGDEWIVAGANAPSVSSFELDYSFLGAGDWTATCYTDVPDDYTNITVTTKSVTASTRETVSMVRNGGFVYRIVKA